MSAEEIQTEINFIASKINQFILSNVSGNPDHLYDASLHYIKSGGKRLRPFMSVKSCQLFGGTLEASIPYASSVELIHNFTLVHDDIMDNDNLRHNVASVHKQFGVPVAILSGDILFSKAFQIISYYGKKAGLSSETLIKMVNLLSSSCIEICEGQALDIKMSTDVDFSSKEEYLNMIEKKTAALFKVSCELGTLSSSNYSQTDIENLSNYGKKIGIAFQLIDDLIGIYGDSKITGKAVGNDIREGKKTFPILLAIQNLDPEDKSRLEKIFGKKKASDESIKEIVNKIALIGVDKDVRSIAQNFIEDAFEILHKYDITEPLLSLENSARYIVERRL
ncbi:MAG: polyprenyl synthetase family protein [Thermoproteota archaeon]|nr:polyprenyl synthetase family protein [Thermoproteota archaeon]